MNANQICDLLDVDLVNFIHNIIVLLKIAVPVILVILGMFDFAKGVMSSKEDEIKKGQQTFIKRLIAAALVFFVVTIVQLVMGLVSKEDNSFWDCANQILNGTAGGKYVPPVVEENDPVTTDPGTTANPGATVDPNGSLIKSDDNISCKNHKWYVEYKNCLNNGYNDSMCLTFFQDSCESRTSKPSWTTYSNFDNTVRSMKKYKCTLSTGEENEEIKKQLFSCAMNAQSRADMSFDNAVDACAGIMEYYCKEI